MSQEKKKADREMTNIENDVKENIHKEEDQAQNDPDAVETPEAKEQTSDEKNADNNVQEQKEQPDDDHTESKDSGDDSKEKDKKFFKRKKDKKDKKDEKIEKMTDQLKRQMAEFDNFRKRSEKEKTGMYAMGAKDVVEKILPTVDNFERGLATASDASDPFVDGMNKVYKQLTQTLEDLGVTAIDAVGKQFDPNLHNAVMHVENEDADDNVVVEEFQKGYLYKDSVVRHSMVKVAN